MTGLRRATFAVMKKIIFAKLKGRKKQISEQLLQLQANWYVKKIISLRFYEKDNLLIMTEIYCHNIINFEISGHQNDSLKRFMMIVSYSDVTFFKSVSFITVVYFLIKYGSFSTFLEQKHECKKRT